MILAEHEHSHSFCGIRVVAKGGFMASMMNHTDGWMGGGTRIIAVLALVMVVLLVVMIGKLSKK